MLGGEDDRFQEGKGTGQNVKDPEGSPMGAVDLKRRGPLLKRPF